MASSAYGPVSAPIPLSSPSVGSPIFPGEQALGLKAIYAACRALYPDQPTPLQVTAVRKYWMGGPDPLDFINMYLNPGSPDLHSPAHWHYVTNGLSDLYGDSRLHSQCTSVDEPSGFGFELTLRLLKEPDEISPPTWPAHLLQSIARYIFHSQAQLMVGDHIPWSSALDKQSRPPHSSAYASDSPSRAECPNTQSVAMAAAAATAASLIAANDPKCDKARFLSDPSTYASMLSAALSAVNSVTTTDSTTTSAAASRFSSTRGLAASSSRAECDSRIRHMLVVEDPQLKKISTPYGYVQFLQLVGLCDEELRLVQKWTGKHVMELMIRLPETGGGLLVTNMNRNSSLFDLDPTLEEFVNEQLRRDGSNLSGVTTHYFAWSAISLSTLVEPIPGELESQHQRHLAKQCSSFLLPGLNASGLPPMPRGNVRLRSVGSPETVCLPTDLSMPRNSQTRCSPSPIAMETDEPVACFEPKTGRYDDDFVDVVGDSDHSSVTGSNVCQTDLPKDSEVRIFDRSENSAATRTKAVSAQSSSETNPSQPLSAPGGFSSWCARLTTGTTCRNSSNALSNNSAAEHSCSSQDTPIQSDSTELLHPTVGGSFGFKNFTADYTFPQSNSLAPGHIDHKGANTPGSVGEGSAPCTPLAHLSLSPATLDLLPTRVIDCLDIQLCRDAGEMLPLAMSGRLKHGRHFTFLNANFPDHAITLVPSGVSGAFVSEETPYVARGPWLQILLPDSFLEVLERQLSAITIAEESLLPLVFRWPERKLRICLVDPAQSQTRRPTHSPQLAPTNYHQLLPKSVAPNSPDSLRDWSGLATAPNASGMHCPLPLSKSGRTASASKSSNFAPTHDGPIPSPLFPYFSPGCIPTPAMLTAMFNSTSGSHPLTFSHHGSVRNPSMFTSALPHSHHHLSNTKSENNNPAGGGDGHQFPSNDAMTYWAQLFSWFLQTRNTTVTSTTAVPPTSSFNSAQMHQQGLSHPTASTISNFIQSATQSSGHPVSRALARHH